MRDLLLWLVEEWRDAREIGGLAADRSPLTCLHERHLPPLLDADQVAAWLRLASRRQVLELARCRVLPSVKIGRRILFRRDGILRALEKAEIPAISDEELVE